MRNPAVTKAATAEQLLLMYTTIFQPMVGQVLSCEMILIRLLKSLALKGSLLIPSVNGLHSLVSVSPIDRYSVSDPLPRCHDV